MNKGYAFGFLLVLLVLALGSYVALTSFRSTRAALRAEPSSAPQAQAGETTEPAASPSATPTAMPTPIPGLTATLTALAQPSSTVAPTAAPTKPGKTPAAKKGKATATPTVEKSQATGTPTPTPRSRYEFQVAGPPRPDPDWASCCYIEGFVRDASGQGVEGIHVQAHDQWNALPPAVTKGGSEAGKYDIPVNRTRTTWYVQLTDAAGHPLSGETPVLFDPAVANAVRLDWRRTN